MEERMDHEIKGGGCVSESIVTVKTLVATTTTETVVKNVVGESGERVGVLEDLEDGEQGDVMLEVLGSEVFFDGVGRDNGEMGSDDFGGADVGFEVRGGSGDGCVGVASEPSGESDDRECTDVSRSHDGRSNVDEKVVEAVVEGGVESRFGSEGGVVELHDNGIKLCKDSSSFRVEDSSKVQSSMLDASVRGDGAMDVSVEESVDLRVEENKAKFSASADVESRSREQDFLKEGDTRDVSGAGARYESSELVVEAVNGGIVSAEATDNVGKSDFSESVMCSANSVDHQKTGHEIPAAVRSVPEDSENANLKLLHKQTQVSVESENFAISISDPEPDTIEKKAEESLNYVTNENSNDTTFAAAGVGDPNGGLIEMEDVTEDMEFDAVNKSPIQSENWQPDLKVKDDSIEKKAVLASLSKAPAEEAEVTDMAIDAAEFKSNKNTKLSTSMAPVIVDEQVVDAEDTVKNMDGSVKVRQTMLEAEIPHVSVSCNLKADVNADPRSHGTDEFESYASLGHPFASNDHCVAESIFQEAEHKPDSSVFERLNIVASDGISENSSNRSIDQVCSSAKDAQELPDGQVGSVNKYKDGELSNHVTFGDDAKDGKNVEAAHMVQEEALVTDQAVSMDCIPTKDQTVKMSAPGNCSANDVAEVPSNVDDILAVREETVNAEQVTSDMFTEGEVSTTNHHLDSGLPILERVPDAPIGGGTATNSDHGHDEQPSCAVQTSVGGEDQGHGQRPGNHVTLVDTNMKDVQDVKEQVVSTTQADSPEQEESEEEPDLDSAKSPNKEGMNSKSSSSKPGGLLKDQRISYQLPPEDDGEFSVFDLVWGKVKSHPWWPGQIFHPSDSSEKAMKYYRKDCYLVAYFGDRSFAWNEASVLKPFRKQFAVAERQNKTESFQNAVNCALAEVSRRMELGLSCSCISEEAIDKIQYQIVENAGIREESSKREGVDRCTGADYFQPDKLVEYVRSLALFPTSAVDRLELTIAKSQLLAFNRLKGIDTLADFEYYEGLMEYDADAYTVDKGLAGQFEHGDSFARTEGKTALKGAKRKHNLKDIVYQRRKEKSMTELMGETMYYLDGEFDSHEEDDNMLVSPISGMKRKAGPLDDDFTSQQSRKTISLAKVSNTASSNIQQSFKVGECIRRVASQLTGSPSIMKGGSDGSSDRDVEDDSDGVLGAPEDSHTEMSPTPSEESSLDEMLSQLRLSAQDPMKGYGFLGNIISFFAEFRNLAVSTQRQIMRKASSRKRKSSAAVVGAPGTFEFDDRNDSYWTDMVVQNSAEAKPPRRSRKRKDDQLVPIDSEKRPRPQLNARKSSRKQYFHGAQESAVPAADEKQQSLLPAELMLNFTEMSSMLSEPNLNKMFRRFGPLKESETEVDAQSNRARVVFKKRSDAEVAYSSAAVFNIFGSTLVNYQLNYTPSVPFRTALLALTEGQKDET